MALLPAPLAVPVGEWRRDVRDAARETVADLARLCDSMQIPHSHMQIRQHKCGRGQRAHRQKGVAGQALRSASRKLKKVFPTAFDGARRINRRFAAVTLFDFAADAFVPAIPMPHPPAARQPG